MLFGIFSEKYLLNTPLATLILNLLFNQLNLLFVICTRSELLYPKFINSELLLLDQALLYLF